MLVKRKMTIYSDFNSFVKFHTALLFLVRPQSWLIFQTIFDKLVGNFLFQNPCITLREPLSCLFSLVFKKSMEICYFYQLVLANTWCTEIVNGGHILLNKNGFLQKQYWIWTIINKVSLCCTPLESLIFACFIQQTILFPHWIRKNKTWSKSTRL